jgi:alkylation response protein AidB-like acyl-CoA dehydrogenase
MDFDFSNEQYMFQQSVRELLARELSLEQLRRGAPAGLWTSLAELGVFAALVPEADGGMGLGFTDLALVFEEFGRALVPSSVAASIIAGAMIAREGTAAQRRLLPGLANGSRRLALATAEPLSAPGAKATPRGSGWIISGRKILVPDAVPAEHLLVSADFDGQQGLFLVETGQEGVGLTEQRTLDIANTWHAIEFDAVPAGLLGDSLDTRAVAHLDDAGAVVAALQMTGIAAQMLDAAVGYVGQRVQFDKVIGSFQAIKHRCADLAVELEASRSAAYYAAWALDEADASGRRRAASMAKAWCGEKSARACNESIQLHGGTGFTWELGLHLFLRRAKIEQSLWGDANWHRERLMQEFVGYKEAAE